MISNNIPVCDSTETLYLSHHSWLKSWLSKRLGCPERAADFSHETFLCVLNRPNCDILLRPRAFLSIIATRLLIDHSRRQRIERTWLETHGKLAAEYAQAPSAEELVEIINSLERITRMLDGLAERPRKAFLMFRLDGMAQADIARELNVSVSMVKKYVAQGLLHCHRALHSDTNLADLHK